MTEPQPRPDTIPAQPRAFASRRSLCMLAAGVIFATAMPVAAQAVDFDATRAACTAKSTDFAAMVSGLEAAGWSRVAPADLSDADLTLFAFSNLMFSAMPGVTDAPRWKTAWASAYRGATGLRPLRPSEGPKVFREFLRADNAVMRAELTVPGGPTALAVCTFTVAGQGAADQSERPVDQIQIAQFPEPSSNQAPQPATYWFRLSAISGLIETETLTAEPDLVATFVIPTQINTDQVNP